MTTAERIEDPTVGIRRLPIGGFLVIVAAYLGIVQGLTLVLTRGDDVEYGVFSSSRDVWTNLIPALLAAFVFVYAVVAVLGWWRPVLIDHRPVRRWVWIVPSLMVAACVAGTYYAGLADKGAGFVVTFAIAMLLVGFGEEGMFRGIGVTAFRVNGYSEWKVALWTSLVFGLAHATNLFQEGASAILQVLVTAAAGFFFYLVRRVSGGLLLAALIHAMWDFALLSGSVEEDYLYPGAAVFVLMDVVIVIILLARRRHIEPAPVEPAPTAVMT